MRTTTNGSDTRARELATPHSKLTAATDRGTEVWLVVMVTGTVALLLLLVHTLPLALVTRARHAIQQTPPTHSPPFSLSLPTATEAGG